MVFIKPNLWCNRYRIPWNLFLCVTQRDLIFPALSSLRGLSPLNRLLTHNCWCWCCNVARTGRSWSTFGLFLYWGRRWVGYIDADAGFFVRYKTWGDEIVPHVCGDPLASLTSLFLPGSCLMKNGFTSFSSIDSHSSFHTGIQYLACQIVEFDYAGVEISGFLSKYCNIF